MVSHNRRVTGLVPPCVEEALQKKTSINYCYLKELSKIDDI